MLNVEIEDCDKVINAKIEDGVKGDRGLSAYQVAVQEGFVGTIDEWLESLVGPPVPVAQELGDDPDLAVSQKLLKDSIDSMEFNSSEAVSEAERLNSLSRQAANSAAEASSAAAESASKAASSESIASDKAEFASQSADSASNSLAYVLEKADEAELNADRAEGAAALAEAASDAAFVNADVYPDVASGRAAVANGEQFQVVDGVEVVRYRRDSASSQTEVARFPSASYVSLLSLEAKLECAPANLNFDFESEVVRLAGSARLYYGRTVRPVSPTTLDITAAPAPSVCRLTINTNTLEFGFDVYGVSTIAANEVVIGYFRKQTHEVWGVDRYVINGRPSFGRYTLGTLLALGDDTINLNTTQNRLEILAGVRVVVDGKTIHTVSSQVNVPYAPIPTFVDMPVLFDTVSKNFSIRDFTVSVPESTITVGYLKTRGGILTCIPNYTVDGRSSKLVVTENILDDAVTPDKTNFARIGQNLFDKESVTRGVSLTDTGELVPMITRSTSDFIPVSPGEEYNVSHTGAVLLEFHENKTPIGKLVSGASYPYTTTPATAFVRLSILTDDIETFQLVRGSVVPPYKEHSLLEIPDLKVFGNQVAGFDDILSRLAVLEDKITYHTPETLLNFELLGGWSVLSVATSYDGNLHIFGKSTGNTMLHRSQDGGETFEQGMPIAALPESDGVQAFTVFEDGTVSIVARNGQIYHAESYDGSPTLVHTIDSRTSKLATNSFSGDGKQYIFVGGYDHTTARKQMVVSKDGGRTFELLRNGGELNAGNNHWHAATYDPYSDMVWLSEGDGDNSKILYTQDWGATWNTIPGTHPTTIYPFRGRVVFGRDKAGERPGIDVWDRQTGLPVNLKGALTFRDDLESPEVYPTRSDWHSNNPDEYYMLFPTHLGDESYIYGTGDAGKSWHLIYHGDLVRIGLTGVDKSGYVFAGGAAGFYRARAVKWA